MNRREDNKPVTEADLAECGARICREVGELFHLFADMLFERADKERK